MKENKINGFTVTQIFQLYAYLVAYEESGIEKYSSMKAMLEEHPMLSEVTKVVQKVVCHKTVAHDMKSIDFKSLKNEIYQTNVKKNKVLSFLAHIRNSIAHGDCVENKNHVLITDYANPKYNPVDFTARGCVEFEIINQITRILNKIEL